MNIWLSVYFNVISSISRFLILASFRCRDLDTPVFTTIWIYAGYWRYSALRYLLVWVGFLYTAYWFLMRIPSKNCSSLFCSKSSLFCYALYINMIFNILIFVKSQLIPKQSRNRKNIIKWNTCISLVIVLPMSLNHLYKWFKELWNESLYTNIYKKNLWQVCCHK